YIKVLVGEPGKEVQVWNGPNNNFPPETGGKCELKTEWESTPNVDVTNIFKRQNRNGIVNFKIRVSVGGAGEGYGRIKLRY
ncbi:hypothetical protein, partial [Streptomyces turgidiscabies]